MKTTIWGDILPAVTIDLEQGESIYTESGAMTWMSDKIKNGHQYERRIYERSWPYVQW